MAKIRIWNDQPSALMTFRTEAGWAQRVYIIGTGIGGRWLEGSGNCIQEQIWVGPGSWEVEGWYLTPGTSEWIESRAVGGNTRAGFDDGAGDGDFNDAEIVITCVLPQALKLVSEFTEKFSPQSSYPNSKAAIVGTECFDDALTNQRREAEQDVNSAVRELKKSGMVGLDSDLFKGCCYLTKGRFKDCFDDFSLDECTAAGNAAGAISQFVLGGKCGTA